MKIKENKSLFLKFMGDTPQLRVLDFLIDNHFFDYPVTGIARESNVSYNSFKLFFPYFVKSRIIIKTRKVGKSDYYRLNIEHPFIVNLMKMDQILIKNSLDSNKFENKNKIEELKNKIIGILKGNDVVRAGIFGSFARGEERKDSDVDILVEFKGNKSLFDISGLKLELEDELKRPVDLLTYKYISPLLKKRILDEEVKIL